MAARRCCFLSIDPSWRGFAMVLYSVQYKTQQSICIDITQQKPQKTYSTWQETAKGVSRAFRFFLDSNPGIEHLLDTVIIEQQFKTNMHKIKHIVEAEVFAFFGPDIKVDYVQAFRVKDYYGIDYKNSSHANNKKNVLKYFQETDDEFLRSFGHITDDNIADAILQLGYYLRNRKAPKKTMPFIEWNPEDEPQLCDLCQEPLVCNLIKNEKSKFRGKYVVSCRNYTDHNGAEKEMLKEKYGNSFVVVPSPFEWHTKNKPTKKRTTPPTIPATPQPKRQKLERTPSIHEDRDSLACLLKIAKTQQEEFSSLRRLLREAQDTMNDLRDVVYKLHNCAQKQPQLLCTDEDIQDFIDAEAANASVEDLYESE